MYFSRLGLAIALCCILGLFLSSCNIINIFGGSNGTKQGTQHKHIYDSFSGPQEGHWPPAPKNASNISGLPNFSAIRVQNAVAEVQIAAILNKDSALQQALGQRFTSFEIDILENSGDLAQSSYFNYDSNETIDVIVTSDGEVQLETFAASQQQPPENIEEISKAIELAKDDFLNNGFNKVSELQGTAMLAFPKRDYVTETGNSFFPTRKLYVTFGVGGGLEPDYSALVDLSSNTVDVSGTIGRY